MTTSVNLRRLIRACVDDERTLRHERRFVDAGRGKTLARLAHEREHFISELERFSGGSRRHDGSWPELLREAGRNIWVKAAGVNNGDAVAACRHSRARTESLYDDAMQWTWPDEVRRLLETQRGRLHDEALALNRLQF
jgi:hypothetical protein